MTTTSADNQTLNVSNSHIDGDSNKITGNQDHVSGNGDAIYGSFNQLHGDQGVVSGDHNTIVGNHDFILGPAGLFGDGVTGGANHNTIKGNLDWVVGSGNKLTGDNLIASGQANVIHDVSGGTIAVGGDDNFVFANHSDDIKLVSGTGNQLDFAGAKQGYSTVEQFISGDEVLVGKGQKTSLSSDADGTTLHITGNNHHVDVLFSGTDLATVKDGMHVVGNHVNLPTFNG